MKSIDGISIKKLPSRLEKMGDLISYEGPILSHFVSQHNEDFLFFWVETDDFCNRWMVYKVTNSLLHQFFNNKLSNRDLVQLATDGFVFFVDIDDDLAYAQILITPIDKIPSDYLPAKDSFYEPDLYEIYAQQLSAYVKLAKARVVQFNDYKEIPDISVAMESDSPVYQKKKK